MLICLPVSIRSVFHLDQLMDECRPIRVALFFSSSFSNHNNLKASPLHSPSIHLHFTLPSDYRVIEWCDGMWCDVDLSWQHSIWHRNAFLDNSGATLVPEQSNIKRDGINSATQLFQFNCGQNRRPFKSNSPLFHPPTTRHQSTACLHQIFRCKSVEN